MKALIFVLLTMLITGCTDSETSSTSDTQDKQVQKDCDIKQKPVEEDTPVQISNKPFDITTNLNDNLSLKYLTPDGEISSQQN